MTTGTPIFGGINQTPFFGSTNVRQQLNFSPSQFDRLNAAYQQAWTNYNQGLSQIGTLPPTDRAARQQQLANAFFQDFDRAANGVLPAQQWQRLHQLDLQSRGFNVFSDPTVIQGLKLTPQQQAEFNRLGQSFNNRLTQIDQLSARDRTQAIQQFNALQSGLGNQINSVLTPAQRQQWQTMIGQPFVFQPYFSGPAR